MICSSTRAVFFGSGPWAASMTSSRRERSAFRRSSTPPTASELRSCATANAERSPRVSTISLMPLG